MDIVIVSQKQRRTQLELVVAQWWNSTPEIMMLPVSQTPWCVCLPRERLSAPRMVNTPQFHSDVCSPQHLRSCVWCMQRDSLSANFALRHLSMFHKATPCEYPREDQPECLDGTKEGARHHVDRHLCRLGRLPSLA